MTFPPGLVGVMGQDTARFTAFWASLTTLQVPEGTQTRTVIGYNVPSSMNDLVRTALAGDAEWLWILGDDHGFNDQILLQLLACEKDIVVPVCLTRLPPYKPVAFSGWVEEGESYQRWRVRLEDHPDGGLVPIHSAGSGGMLIRRHVLEALDDPWFEYGRVSRTDIGEDVYFCDKARDMGFEIWLDLDTRLGHCTTATVWPVLEPDGWTYGFGFVGGLKLTLPVGTWERADEAAREKVGA